MRKWRHMEMKQLYLYLLLSLAPSVCQENDANLPARSRNGMKCLWAYSSLLCLWLLLQTARLTWGRLQVCSKALMWLQLWLMYSYIVRSAQRGSSQTSEATRIALERDVMHVVLLTLQNCSFSAAKVAGNSTDTNWACFTAFAFHKCSKRQLCLLTCIRNFKKCWFLLLLILTNPSTLV